MTRHHGQELCTRCRKSIAIAHINFILSDGHVHGQNLNVIACNCWSRARVYCVTITMRAFSDVCPCVL